MLPARPRMVRIQAEIPLDRMDEYRQMYAEVMRGARPRIQALEHELQQITGRAMLALDVIATAVHRNPGTGQAGRLVRFIAGCYNGAAYPFDLTDLRGLDTALANACLDYLNYDRLAIREVHHHLPGGDAVLHRWLREYGIEPASGRHS